LEKTVTANFNVDFSFLSVAFRMKVKKSEALKLPSVCFPWQQLLLTSLTLKVKWSLQILRLEG